ncbi:MAG: ABC transporter substrate-binding protein [Pseudolabrys sp.]|nr:ABC transporter substrate-binding protein [Pseudolabrys sp.]
MKHVRHYAGATIIAATLLAVPAMANDTVKMTIGQRGNWDTAIPHLGEKAGIFKKHGITMEMVYTRGSGETVQPVISGNVDLGLAVGTLGAIGYYAKGAPVRIVAAQATGAADYWYAKTDSGIKTLKDSKGKTIAYSTNGSSTHSMVLAFIKEYGLDVKPTATGSPPATLTSVMSGQVDIGWASPPFGLREIEEGKIQLVARGGDTKIIGGQTIRVIIANTDAIKNRKEVLRRFLKAYAETIDYMYSDNPQVITDYAEFAKITPALAKRVREEFFPKSLLQMTDIKGLDQMLKDAVELKYAPKELTKEQVEDLVQTSLNK